MARLTLLPAQALLVAALLMAALAGGCGHDAPPATGPLGARAPQADLGRVFEGQVLEHEFELDVHAPLVVSAAETDCGCTLARIERAGPSGREPYEFGAALAPGERIVVRARYDTRGRRGRSARAVTLTAVPGGIVRLALVADVQPWLAVEPAEFELTRLLEGAGAERTFQVRSASGEPFGLRATGRALAPWVTVEVAPRVRDDSGRAALWDGRVALASTAPRGTFSYPIELESDVPVPGPTGEEARNHSVSPPWTLQIVGPVALSRPNLEFGLVRGDETVAQSLRLESFEPGFVPDSATARLEPVRPDEPFPLARTAAVHTRLVGGACEIEVTLAGLDPAVTGTFLARLVVETGHPRLPRLEAVVRGVRAPPGIPR